MQECERNQIVDSETLKWERDRVVRYGHRYLIYTR